MKTPRPLGTLACTVALLISVGTASRLAAQTSLTLGHVPTTKPGVIRFVPTRSYTGTATQTTAAGVKTTGTFTLLYAKSGWLSATTIFNGVSTTYDGMLPQVSFGGISGQHTGYLLTNVPKVSADGSSIGYFAVLVPLIVDKSVASGGLQNVDGSALTFYAERDATVVGSGH